MKTKVGDTDNSDAHARLDVAKGGRTRAPPFFAEELSGPFEGVDCLRAEHPIDGHNKRNKVVAMRVTLLWAFFFFVFFRGNPTLLWIFVGAGLGI